jgi:hypothetical protein
MVSKYIYGELNLQGKNGWPKDGGDLSAHVLNSDAPIIDDPHFSYFGPTKIKFVSILLAVVRLEEHCDTACAIQYNKEKQAIEVLFPPIQEYPLHHQ